MISACLLVRDDEATLVDCLESIRPHVDELCILDTGSIDSSPQIAKRYADRFEVYLGCNSPDTEQIADFADARNHVLNMATGDVHFWADGDDVVRGLENLRPLADQLGPEALILVAYEYQHDAAGRVVCEHWRENIVKPRDKWKWSIPVHEVMLPQGIAPVATPVHNIRRIHRKQLSTRAPDPERNLRILKRYVGQVGEGDVRAWYYLGVEYSMRNDTSNALRVLKRYVELAGWHDEKCLALLEVARIYQRMGDWSLSIEWAQRAMLTKSWPEPYFLICECFAALCDQGVDPATNMRRAAHFGELGLSMKDGETVLFVNPMKRFDALNILARIYVTMGMVEQALAATKQYLATIPEDVEMQRLSLQCEDVLAKNTLVLQAQRSAGITAKLRELGAFDPGQWAQVHQLVGGALGMPQPTAAMLAPVHVAPQPKADGCLDVVFYLGQAYEPWNPVTLQAGGMGGSETMAWELARRLRSIGHRVRVFAHCNADQEGVFDGVEWLNFDKYQAVECDVLVSSRRADAADGDVRALARLVWVHDCHLGESLTPARSLRWDRILCLSEWHKSFMLQCYAAGAPALIAALRPEQIEVTRNGIDLGRFSRGDTLALGTEPGGPVGHSQLPPEFGGEKIPRWEIPGSRIIIGGAVLSAQDWASLEAMGVTHCISITDPPDVGVPPDRMHHDATGDHGAPFTPEHVGRVVSFARKALAGGGKLYLHCWIGASRSPSFAYAVLRAVYGMGKQEAHCAICTHYPWGGGFGSDPKHVAYMNSIDACVAPAERNPKRVVYSSSPDRGLQTLLEMWPAILKQEPEAELHVFYGFDGWEKSAPQYGEAPYLGVTSMRQVKHMIRSLPRVTAHGRVSGAQLAGEMLVSGVWAYPTWFCCHPDTRISVPGDHRGGPPTVRIADMVGKSGFPVYAFNEEANRFEIRTCLRVWESKVADELVAIELDSGETLKVTPDHRVLTFDGDWVEAGTLKPGDSLKALHYRYNVAIRDGNGRWADEHRLVGTWKAGRKLRRDEHVDHSDPIRLDNRPESLTVMTASEHFSKTHKGKRLSKKHIERKRQASIAAIAAMSPEKKRAWHTAGTKAAWEAINAMPPDERAAWIANRSSSRKKTLANRKSLPLPYEAREGHNHKVVSVSRIPGPIPVYDMEVEGLHNFIADGIVVHNCETSCITAMEAQAAGLYTVATPIAALVETASQGTLVPGAWQSPDGPTDDDRAAFVQAVVNALRGEQQPKTREELQSAADRFDLDSLAKDWDAMLRRILSETEESVLPGWVA